MKKLIIKIIVSILFISSISSLSYARRVKEVRHYIRVYNIVEDGISSINVDNSYSFSFPVGLSSHHVAAHLSFKKMVENGLLPKGIKLLCFDAHLDYISGDRGVVQSSNWIRFSLDEGLFSSATVVLPEWLVDSVYDICRYKMVTAEHDAADFLHEDLRLSFGVDNITEDLSSEPVFLSIDCDYFSCIGYPEHRPSLSEIKIKIEELIQFLKVNNIKIAALDIAISPGYTHLDHQSFIKNMLLEAFANYEND